MGRLLGAATPTQHKPASAGFFFGANTTAKLFSHVLQYNRIAVHYVFSTAILLCSNPGDLSAMPRFRTQQILRITNAIVYVSAIVVLLLDLLVWRPN